MSKQKQIRALSVRQPYAEQMMQGKKEIEYRSVKTNIRGRIYIYASLGKGNSYDIEDGAKALNMSVEEFHKMPRGVLVGTVELVDCVGEPGDYEWCLGEPIRIAKPLKPNPEEQPQPVWFYPFGKPEESKQPRKKVAKKNSAPIRVAKKKATKVARKKVAKKKSPDPRPVRKVARKKVERTNKVASKPTKRVARKKADNPQTFARKKINDEFEITLHLEKSGIVLGGIEFFGGDDIESRVLFTPHDGNYGYGAEQLRRIADEMDRVSELDDDKPIPKTFAGEMEF